VTTSALAFALLVGVAAAVPAQAQEVPADSVSSIDRVRAGLAQRSLRLTLPERPADFTVRIVERRPLQEIFETVPWATPPVGWSPYTMSKTMFGTPVASINLLPLFQSAAGAIGAARYHRAQREAASEVGQAIAAYCAAQSDGGAGIQICSTSPASR